MPWLGRDEGYQILGKALAYLKVIFGQIASTKNHGKCQSVSQKCTNPGHLVVQGTIFCTVATNIFRLIIAAVLTYKNVINSHAPRRNSQARERCQSKECREDPQKILSVTLQKFSRQYDLAPMRKAEKDSTANLQQPHQPAQYLPFASVNFSSRTPKQFLTQVHTHTQKCL